MEEKELVKASQEGNEEAFALLVKKFQTKVFDLAFSLTLDREIADDLAQEVFIKAYYSLPGFKLKSKFGTWLYRITMNHIKDYLRKRSRMKEISVDDSGLDSISLENETLKKEEEQVEEQKRRILYRLVGELPEKYRSILTLRDIQGFSYREISKILNISADTVDSRLYRARRRLRSKLALLLAQKGGER